LRSARSCYLVGCKNFSIFLLFSFLRSLGLALSTVRMFMFTPDCVEYGTFKTGERAEGITYSLQTFADKLVKG
jgi:Na+/melibiose symporter-like transporter